jgi:hypothetical protein
VPVFSWPRHTRFLDHNDAVQSVGLLLDEWSARRRDLYLTTHNTHTHTPQTNIHTPGGIRTHDRSKRAAVDLRGRDFSYFYVFYPPFPPCLSLVHPTTFSLSPSLRPWSQEVRVLTFNSTACLLMNSYICEKCLPYADITYPVARSTLKAVAVLRFIPLFGCFKASCSFRSAAVTNAMVNDLHSAFLLSLYWAPGIAAGAGLLYAKVAILGDAINWAL